MITSSGDHVPILKTVVPITIQGEALLLEVFQDISGLVSAELETRHLNRKLQEATIEAKRFAAAAQAASIAKSTFLTTMSHEIRTPLNGIVGLADLLAEADLNDVQREALDRIHACAGSLLETFREILDYCQLERGQVRLNQEPLSLPGLLADVAHEAAGRVREKMLRLECKVAADLPDALLGDRERIAQLLRNLLANAVEFTPAGSVSLTADVASRSAREAYVRFSVRDTGKGIDVRHHDRVFDPFYQIDGSTTREVGGVGLGLAISKQLVERMNGRIEIESRPGAGTEIRVTLPFGLPAPGDGEIPPS